MENKLNKKSPLLIRLKRTFNLCISDFKRIKQDIFMIIVAALGVLSVLALCGMFKLVVLILQFAQEEELPKEALTAINQTFSSLSFGIIMSYNVLGFFIIAALSIFSSRDFGFKTIRLKVHSGNSRTKIFLSALLTNLCIGLVFFAFGAVATTLINFMLFGVHFYDGAILINTLLSLLPYISTITIATFITMATRSQITSLVLNIGIAYIVPQLTLILSMFFTHPVAQNIIGSLPYQTINEIFIGSMSTMTAIDGSDLNTLISSPSLSLILRSTLAPAVIIFTTIFVGLKIFKKADLN